MPCDKCREKLKAKGVITASIVPDKYKDPTESAGLSKAKVDRSTKLGNPYKPRPCKICDKEILEVSVPCCVPLAAVLTRANKGHYCPTCSYKKGICKYVCVCVYCTSSGADIDIPARLGSLCGKRIVNTTTEYRSTNA